MRKLGLAAKLSCIIAGSCIIVGAASAQYSRVFGGVPGFYNTDAITGWKLNLNLDPNNPMFVPEELTSPDDPAACKFGVKTINIAPNDLNKFRDFMTSMSSEQYERFVQQGFAGQPLKVTDIVKPVRADQDGNPGYMTIMTLTHIPSNLSLRSRAVLVANTNGLTSTSCLTASEKYASKEPTFEKFVDQTEFLSGETAITASLNRNGVASLKGVTISKEIEFTTDGDPTTLGRDLLVKSLTVGLPFEEQKTNEEE